MKNAYLTLSDPSTIARISNNQKLDYRERYYADRMRRLAPALGRLKIEVVANHPGLLSAVISGSWVSRRLLAIYLWWGDLGSLLDDGVVGGVLEIIPDGDLPD